MCPQTAAQLPLPPMTRAPGPPNTFQDTERSRRLEGMEGCGHSGETLATWVSLGEVDLPMALPHLPLHRICLHIAAPFQLPCPPSPPEHASGSQIHSQDRGPVALAKGFQGTQAGEQEPGYHLLVRVIVSVPPLCPCATVPPGRCHVHCLPPQLPEGAPGLTARLVKWAQSGCCDGGDRVIRVRRWTFLSLNTTSPSILTTLPSIWPQLCTTC